MGPLGINILWQEASVMPDAPLECEPDGLYLPEISLHSLEKISLHNRFARIFGTAMKRKWPQRAYVGLYSGAGRAKVKGTDRIVETSALGVLRQPDPFTNYVYADSNSECTSALEARIRNTGLSLHTSVICGDVNSSAARVKDALPPYSRDHGLLSFCFIDPFDLQIRFDTIRQLSPLRMDIMVLLMLGVDGRRNFLRYFQDETSTRIADLIDCPDWRYEYRINRERNPVRFILRKFDEAMTGVGYNSAMNDVHTIKSMAWAFCSTSWPSIARAMSDRSFGARLGLE